MSASSAPDATEIFASYLVDRRHHELPVEVDAAARQALSDSIGCAIAGARTAPSRAAYRTVVENGGSAQATAIGSQQRFPVISAAFINTLFARAQIYDDSNSPGRGHADSATGFTALALAESGRRSLGDVLRSIALGAEIAARVGGAAGDAHANRGFHGTGTAVVFGTAAAAAAMMDLPGEAVQRALSLAAEQACGLRQFQEDGDRANSAMHAAIAARNGVHAAQLAKAGFPAPYAMLGGRFGFLNAFGADPSAAERVVADLGAGWRLLDASIKPFPSSRATHAPATAIRAMRAQHGMNDNSIAALRIWVSEHAMRADRSCPRTAIDAQFSIQYIVARILAYGPSLCDEDFDGERLSDPRLIKLQQRISVACEPSFAGTACRIEMELTDGRSLAMEVPLGQSLGDPGNPLTENELWEKFFGNVGPSLTEDTARALFNLVLHGATEQSVGDIAAILASCRVPGSAS